MSALTQRRQFNVSEYYKMAESGILSADDRVELISGEVVEMSPIGSRHAACVKRLLHRLAVALGDRAILGVQDPVRLDDFSEPEPDLSVLKPHEDFYAAAHPGPRDVLWLIEVSDASLVFDRRVKLPLYAAHGIPEVWVVSLVENLVEVHREPVGTSFTSKRKFRREARLSPAAFPDLGIDVASILGSSN